MISTMRIQSRLLSLGYNPGPIDGIRGRQTIKAIKQYQTDSGLAPDGIVGPITRTKLFDVSSEVRDGFLPMALSVSSALEPDLPWYEEAQRLIGVREIAGDRSSATIMDWAEDLDIWYPGDDVPWCGLFPAHCIGATLPEEQLPANPLGARNWRKFGRGCEPTRGSVLVFWRTHPTRSGNGHVGFYAGEDTASYYVLGGNQSNMVNITRLKKDRLIEARFPVTAPLGERKIVLLTPENASERAFSTDER